MATQWERMITSTRVRDIASTNITSLESSSLLKDFLPVLKEKKILSIPLYEGDNKNNIVGLVDVLDITAYALALWRDYARNYVQRTETKFSESEISQKFFNTPVRDLINYSGRNQLLTIDADGTLKDALLHLNRHRFRAHRLLVTRNNNREFVGLLTQSDIVRFMSTRIDDYMLSDLTLDQINLVNPCIMVRFDRPLIETLSLLVENKVSGIALVDWEFKIVANFSASDLKGVLPEAFDLFWRETIDFLRSGTDVKSMVPPVTCSSKSTFRETLTKMLSSSGKAPRIHRVFITKEGAGNTDRLDGITSITDVISALAEGLSTTSA
jgi:CBS domain-containing protein